MQNEEVNDGKSVDYDQLSHNAAPNEMETDGFENDSTNKKDKTRRYWTAKEEEKFFEIWGRENWRLTRHGKNTVFFAQWSRELKERFDMDIKPEEVQAKVNQTRAKFRSVKKSMETDFIATKWKKYDIIDRILKNQYRSENDDPIPKEALENNRDFSPNSRQVATPNSITSNSTQDALNHSGSAFGVTGINNTSHLTNDEDMSVKIEPEMPNNLYGETQTNHNYNTDMYGEQYPREIKTEFEEEFQNYNYGDQMHYGSTQEPHLHQLQTPQQPQPPPQQNQQHSIYGAAPPHPAPTNIMHPTHHMPTNMNPIGQDVTQLNAPDQNQPAYEPVSNPTYTNLSDQTSYSNGTYNANYNTAAHPSTGPPVPPPMPQVQNATGSMGPSSGMQPPRPATCSTPLPRKRGRPLGPSNNSVNSGNALASSSSATINLTGDALESQYMEQVRKKNNILEESRDISKKRLEAEERKIKLMEDYFPKLFNLQHEILDKVNSISTNSLNLINTLNSHFGNINPANANINAINNSSFTLVQSPKSNSPSNTISNNNVAVINSDNENLVITSCSNEQHPVEQMNTEDENLTNSTTNNNNNNATTINNEINNDT